MARYLNLKKIFELLGNFQFDPELSNYKQDLIQTSEIDKYPKINNQFFLLFDIPSAGIIYIDDNVGNMMGFDPDKVTFQFLYNQIITEDRNTVVNASEYALKVFKEHPEIKFSETTFEVDFRIKKNDGTIIRLLSKTCIYKKDKLGFPLMFYSLFTDISRLKKSNIIEVVAEGPDKHLFNYKKKVNSKPKNKTFTVKEMQILQKLSEGKCCKVIAKDLDIKISTVYTHCKNMLGKSDFNKMNGLVAFAAKELKLT
jgi:DNA-binding CsgD family transcriptional regulator